MHYLIYMISCFGVFGSPQIHVKTLALIFLRLNIPSSSHYSWLPQFPAAVFVLVALCLCFPLCQCSPSCDAQTGNDTSCVLWTTKLEPLPRNAPDPHFMPHTLAALLSWLHLNTSQPLLPAAPPHPANSGSFFPFNCCEAKVPLVQSIFFSTLTLPNLWLVFFFFEVYLIYNVVLISVVNFWCIAKWFSYSYIYILFHILFHYGLSQDIEYSCLCCTVGPCFFSILYIIVCIMQLIFWSCEQNCTLPPIYFIHFPLGTRSAIPS